MQCDLEIKNIQDIESSNIVQQTSFWAHVKNQQGMKPYAFEYITSDDLLFPSGNEKSYINDDLLVLVRYIDDQNCFAYIPYGPKCEPCYEYYGVFLEKLSDILRQLLPKCCMLIRYDLPWESQWAKEDDFYDNRGNWLGPPSHRNQEFRINFNTHRWNLVKSHTNILPANTIFLNLEQSKENLMKEMKPKTRYNIRLAFRKGIKVRSYGTDQLETWYKLYKETASRNNITLHNIDYFYSVLNNNNSSAEDIDTRLLIADLEGESLAAMFLILSGERGTYLYGASSGKKRNFMATYALQWEAIRIAQQSGCKEYDMFGTAPNSNAGHPMYGLYRFKSGFGGHMWHGMGCWDYPLDKKKYNIFRAQEINNQNFHIH